MVFKKMPCLRSQTRSSATSNNTSTDSVDFKHFPSSLVSTLTNSMSSLGSYESSKTTAFPFPLAPAPTKPKAPSIIDITNPSSEASLSSDHSLVSEQSTAVSSDDPSERSDNLDTAMLHLSHAEDSVPLPESDPDPTLALPSNYSSLLCQSLIPSPLVYIPVLEQPAVDKSGDKALQLTLVDHDCYEFESGMNLRKKVVNELDMLVKQWVRTEGLRQSMNWKRVEQVGGKVVCFGSFKLSVVDKESDMDLLCVVPKHVTRDSFFKTLYDHLGKKDEVTELRQLPWTYVPVIKMQYRGIEVDLTMSRLMVSEKVPEDEDFLRDPRITVDMDQKCLRSFNCYRATCDILELVPCKEKFKFTLRVIKAWHTVTILR